ncbi:MAG: hypothetical protein L6Q92_01250 [Phycisphaerae bacterium]|nr:hypothetical protein [Phycisphaerae bacterium]
MNFNFSAKNTNGNKAAFRTLISQKQQFFKRLARRYNASKNPSERTFLRSEAARVAHELKKFAQQWKKNAFGSNGWVTRGYQVGSFSRIGASSQAYGASKNRARSRRKYHSRRTTRSRNYRSYVAW